MVMLPLNIENILKTESMLPINILDGLLLEEKNWSEKEMNSLNKDVFPVPNSLSPWKNMMKP